MEWAMQNTQQIFVSDQSCFENYGNSDMWYYFKALLPSGP